MKTCACLKEFMRAQMDVVSKHLDEHKYLRNLSDKDEALASFNSRPHRERGKYMMLMSATGDVEERKRGMLKLP